ncbi:MAG: DUF2268 domain-containing putative Zn-dependent protease [bacterium]|nr:DUF2268 domain-containing putative Zn-dependent protease [bacterium]
MKIKLIPVYESLEIYLEKLENKEQGANELWEQYAIAPYWKTLCQYAPMDLSDRKPVPITDSMILRQQIKQLHTLDLEKLQREFERIVSILPNYDDDPIYVALYPISDENWSVKERQNGVVGTSLFGNLIIQINPLAMDYEQWIPYVFAHEYHHTVWGNYWFVNHGGELTNRFINSLVIDGEADSFSLSLYPKLKPKWLFSMSKQTEELLWKDVYSNLVEKTEVDYCKYMFGQEGSEIPWCAGYVIGFQIVQSYLKYHENISFSELVEKRPEQILDESGYYSTLEEIRNK